MIVVARAVNLFSMPFALFVSVCRFVSCSVVSDAPSKRIPAILHPQARLYPPAVAGSTSLTSTMLGQISGR